MVGKLAFGALTSVASWTGARETGLATCVPGQSSWTAPTRSTASVMPAAVSYEVLKPLSILVLAAALLVVSLLSNYVS